MYLTGKKVLLGVSGGIAAYKAAELCRALIKGDAEVKVMMTQNATEFITPLTFESLTGNPVSVELFTDSFTATHHIDLADWADLVLIAPATANTIAKINAGIGDDMFSTVMLAVHSPTVIAPAMNSNMWRNPITKRNVDALQNSGFVISPPESGELACGYTGEGRLAPLEEIMLFCNFALAQKDLIGKKILINGGPTIEDIDAVRYISNRSSGKMATALANEAFFRGAEVTLITGPTTLISNSAYRRIEVRSAQEMWEEIENHYEQNDIFIAAAAVADFTPNAKKENKIKKDKFSDMSIPLKPTIDILKTLAVRKKDKIHIGFALETDSPEKNAQMKLKGKKLDAIILNNPNDKGSAFEKDTNKVTIISKTKENIEIPLASKEDIATGIFDNLQYLFKS